MAPRDRNDPERQRRIDEVRARAQAEASGRTPGDSKRGSVGDPFHVRIQGASSEFYSAFRTGSIAGSPTDIAGQGPGFQASITDPRAAAQQALQITAQMRTASDMMHKYAMDLGHYANTMRVAQKAERAQVSEVLSRIEQSLTGGTRARGGAGSPRGRSDHRAAPPVDPVNGLPIDLGGLLGDPTLPAGPSPSRRPAGHSGGYQAPAQTQFGHHMRGTRPQSIHGMQQLIQRRAGNMLHERFGLGTSHTPTLAAVHDEATGELSHYQLHGPGGVVEDNIHPADSRVPGLVKAGARQAAVSGIGAGLARGGMMGAARAVPVVGQVLAAGELVNKGFEWATEQRKENVAYQSIYGGTNAAGFGQRMQEQGFVWGQRFTNGLTEEDSRRLFTGVSRTGLKDGQRAGLLDFATNQYKQNGTPIDQSMQLIDIAVSHANAGLAGLTTSLNTMTQAAMRTGQSADVMREKFIGNFAAASQAGFGSNAAAIAGGLTLAGPGQNRLFAGLNLTGQMSEPMLRLNAGQQGMSLPQLEAQTALGNTGAFTKGSDKIINQTIGAMVPGEAQSFIQQEIAKRGGADAVANSPGAQREITLAAMQKGYLDPGVLRAGLQGMGVDTTKMDDVAVSTYATSRIANPNAIEKGTAQQQAAQGQKQLGEGDIHAEQRGFGSDIGGGAAVVGSQFVRDSWSVNPFNTSGQAKNQALGSYANYQTMTKHQDPTIEALINQVGSQSEVGVEVDTGDGKKVVSLSEAITNYPDQVAKGTATLKGGTETNDRQIKDVVGFGESNYQGDDTTTKKGGPGGSSEDWTKAHPADGSAGGLTAANLGKVLISASPELAKMFNFQTTGNAKMEGAASAGVPPVPTQVLPK